MSLSHLNSDQRLYFWFSSVFALAYLYLATRVSGSSLIFTSAVAVVESASAMLIYRKSRHAPWCHVLGCAVLFSWFLFKWFSLGYSHQNLVMLMAILLTATGFFPLRRASREEVEENDSKPPRFELAPEYHDHVDALQEAYQQTYGTAQWTHHLVPKTLWLHPYADYVITLPPTETRPTWLYGTLLISALSPHPFELILERRTEDTIGAIGTLARLTQYVIEQAPLEAWHTMGTYPFFGEESPVRGLLICEPPRFLSDSLTLPTGTLEVRYVVGITEEQLNTAQAADDQFGNFSGAKALHRELRIAESGIEHLPI